MKQITNSIMMIKPVGFRYNEQTAVNNYYQQVLDNLTDEQTQEKALNEFNSFVDKLRNVGVNVIVIHDKEHFEQLLLNQQDFKAIHPFFGELTACNPQYQNPFFAF
jgi:hypothetical protein